MPVLFYSNFENMGICVIIKLEKFIVVERRSMSSDNALISTAVLTAIWNESYKDHIDMMVPFVINIIYNKYKTNDKIDEEYIICQLNDKFCFKNFPHAVLKTILKRMKKKGYLGLDSKQFVLLKDLSSEATNFESRLITAKLDASKVIGAITRYLKIKENDKITENDADIYFSNFLSSYGYDAYTNINTIKCIDRNLNVTNYFIGQFIYDEYIKDSEIFKLILRIIEGHMIANAIYLQIEKDNRLPLRDLNCYLDSIFLLGVLGYKTDEENAIAKELYELLIKYGATLKCFKHTYDEIISILNHYKNNINKQKELTLEYFDKENYSEGEVELHILALESRLRKLKIQIVDGLPYTENRYTYVIDEKKLEEKLIEHKIKTGNHFTINAIENDIKSVCYISMLRKGIQTSRIEKCRYIFVTPYRYLKIATNEVVEGKSDTDIGLVIDDLDLTTILWFKDIETNIELPKMRLIENALAATNASDELMTKASKILETIKKNKLISGYDNLSDYATKNFLKASGYVDYVKNDSENVTQENMIEFIVNKDKKIVEMQKELETTKERNLKKEIEIQKKFIKDVEDKANGDYIKRKRLLTIICITFILLFDFSAVYYIINSAIDNKYLYLTGVLFGVLQLIDFIIPKSRKILHIIDKYCDNKRTDYITKETVKILEKYK